MMLQIFSSTCASKLYANDINLYSVLDNPLDYSDLQSNLNNSNSGLTDGSSTYHIKMQRVVFK